MIDLTMNNFLLALIYTMLLFLVSLAIGLTGFFLLCKIMEFRDKRDDAMKNGNEL